MSGSIVVELTSEPLERVESEIVVASFFSDERPLRGGAGRADWRLCGGLSRRILAGDLSGLRGEALLMGCGRALRAPRLLLLGLGERASFDGTRVGDEIHAAVQRCLRLGCTRIGLSPLGVAPDDVLRHAPALAAGLGRLVREPDGGQAETMWVQSIQVRLCIRARELPGVGRALRDAGRSADDDGLEIRIPSSDATSD
jgi:hypothetical protein